MNTPFDGKTSTLQDWVVPSHVKSVEPNPLMTKRPTLWRTSTSRNAKSAWPVHVTVPLIVADPVLESKLPVGFTVRSRPRKTPDVGWLGMPLV